MSKVLWVSPEASNWKVQWEKGDVISRHQLKNEAIIAARRQVRAYPIGHIHQIKVQHADGTMQLEWTYGNDPYPPAG